MIEDSKNLGSRLLAAAVLSLAAACSVSAGGQIPCADDASCPKDYPVCSAQKCVAGTSTSSLSVAIIGIQGHQPTDQLRGTVTVTVTARANTGVKAVTLAAGSKTYQPNASSAAPLYLFDVVTTDLSSTTADVALTATVTGGDDTTATSPALTVHVDNQQPTLTTALIGAANVADGTMVKFDVTTSEVVASIGGTVSGTGSGALSEISAANGLVHHFGYAITAADAEGAHDVTFTTTDLAGNSGTSTSTAAFQVRHPFVFGALVVSTGHTVNEQTGAPAAATVGTSVAVSVTLPAIVALGSAKPVFKLTSAGGTTRTLPASTLTTGTTTNTWASTYLVVSGDNDGVAQVTVSVTDVAGTTPVLAAASLVIDKSPPLASSITGGGVSVDTVHNALTFTAVASKRLQSATIASSNADVGSCTCDGGTCNATTSLTPVVSCSIVVTHGAAATPTVTLTLKDTLGNTSPGTAAYQSTYTVVAAPVNGGLAGTVTIGQGQSTLLTPTFSNGAGVVIGSDGSSYVATNATGISVSPISTTTYTLKVTNAATTFVTSAAATVTVVAPPTITSFTGPSFYVAGQPAGILTAVFTPATGATAVVIGNDGTSVYTCVASPDANTSPATFSCQTPANNADVTYTLTVTGGPVSTSANLTVKVAPDPANSIVFSVNGANPINPGSTTTFTGTVCSGCTFTISPAAAVASASVVGTTLTAATAALSGTTTFTLTVTNQGGATASATQTVTVRTPTIASFTGPAVVAANTSFSVIGSFGPGAITGATAASAAVSGASCGASSTSSPHTFTCASGIAANTTLSLTVTLGTGANNQVSVTMPITVASDTSTTALSVTGNATINPGSTTTFGGTVCTGCTFTLTPLAAINGTPAVVSNALTATSNALQVTTVFTLTVTNQVGVTATQTQTVTVRTPTIASFTGPSFVAANTSFSVIGTFGPGAITGATAASAAVSGASCGASSTSSPNTFTCASGIAANTTLTLTVTLGTGANNQVSVTLPIAVAADTGTTALSVTGNATINPGSTTTFGGTVCTGCTFTLDPVAAINGTPAVVSNALTATSNALQTTTVFTLTVTNQVGATATQTQTVTVRTPSITSFDGPSSWTSGKSGLTLSASFGPGAITGATAASASVAATAGSSPTCTPPSSTTSPQIFSCGVITLDTTFTLTVMLGTGANNTALASVVVKVAPTQSVTAGGTMNVVRFGASITLLPNGKVLIAGGSTLSNGTAPVDTAEVFDPATGNFLAAGAPVACVGAAKHMSALRYRHTGTLLSNGLVLLVGGTTTGAAAGVSATADLYDVNADCFTALGAVVLVTARMQHTATALPNGKVLIAGGTKNDGTPLGAAGVAAELYDPVANSFVAVTGAPSAMSAARTGATATLLTNGMVLIAGGNSGAAAPAELFDYTANSPGNGGFTQTTGNAATRRFHTATLLGGGKVLLAGGSSDGAAANVLAGAELYDPVAKTFAATTGSLGTARMLHTAVLMPSGSVLVAGGTNVLSTALSSTELFDLGTGVFTAAANMSQPRTQHVATFLFNGSALEAAGVNPVARGDLFTP